MRHVFFLLLLLLLLPSNVTWAAPLGISGKWELQGDSGSTLLIDEEARTIFMGDRPMAFDVEGADGLKRTFKLVRDGIPFGEIGIEKKSDTILLLERTGTVQLYLRAGADFSAEDKPIQGRWASFTPNRIVIFDFDRNETTLSLPRLPKPEQLTLNFTPLFSNAEGHFIYVVGEKRGFVWLTDNYLLMCGTLSAGDDPQALRLDKGRCLLMEPAP